MTTSAYNTFLSDPNREDVYLVELYPWDPNADATTTLRFSNREFRTTPAETPASTIWKANSDFIYSYSAPAIPPGTVGLVPTASGGTITLGQKFGDLDYFNTYYWDGRRCVIKHGGYSRAGRLGYSDYQTVRDGEIEKVSVMLDKVILTLREKEDRFNHPVERRKLGFFGDCLEADGASGLVDFADTAKLKITDALSIECVIVPYVVNANQHLIGWSPGPFRLWLDSSAHLNLTWKKSTVEVTKTSAFTFVAKKRYHLGVTLADTKVYFYIYDYAADTLTTELFDGAGFTGRDNPGVGEAYRYFKAWSIAGYYTGQLWNVRLWNTTQTASDIESRRFRRLTDTEVALSALKQYADFSDGTGAVVTDSSPSPTNGAITATCEWRPTLTGLFATDEQNSQGGQSVPNVFGKVYNYSPVVVDEGRHIYQVHAGEVSAISGIFEGGLDDITLDTAYTDPSLFLAATTDPKKYDLLRWSCGSYIRLGSSPSLPITVDVSGDSGEGSAHTVSDIVEELITTRGPSPLAGAEIDTASFTALETGNDSEVGIVIENDMTLAEAINGLLGSIGAIGWFDRQTGDFTVQRFEGVGATAAAISLTEKDIEESLDSVRALDVELPVWEVTCKFKKNWTVLDSASLATAIRGTWRYGFSLTEWRKTTSTHPSNQTDHPRARSMVVETLLQSHAAASTEANRLYTLFAGQAQSLEVVIKNRATTIDRLSVVGLNVRDLDTSGDWQDRLGTTFSTKFVVLGIDDDADSGTTKLTLWRENAF